MNKKHFTLFVCLATIIMAACAPSPQAVQTALAQTQAAWTPTPTPTPTLNPTSTPDLVLAEKAATLFEQDFESGTALGIFDNSGNWSVSTDNSGNHVFCNKISTDWQSFKFGLESWSDYAVEIRVEILNLGAEQNAEIYARINNATSGYRANIHSGGASLAYYPPNKDLGHLSLATSTNTWYRLRVEAAGDRLKFFVNDQLVSSATDSQRLSGMAGFGAAPNTLTCVDDIRAWALTTGGQVAASAPADQVVGNNPLSIYEGDCTFCFVDGSDPSMPVWDDTLGGYRPQAADTRQQIVLDENFSVPAGKTVTFENKIVFFRFHQDHDIQVYGTLSIDHSLLIWEKASYQQTGLRIMRGGQLSIKGSYSFGGNSFYSTWNYEDGSTVYLDHFVGDPWTAIHGTVNYTAINYSTVHVTIFGNVKNTTFKVTDSHNVWLELYPPPGIYQFTFPPKRQWANWDIPDVWPGTDISITNSYVFERDISIEIGVHVTISDTPSGFSLGWAIHKDTPGFVDCELNGLGDPGNDAGVLYQDTTWDLPCTDSSLTVKNSRLQRAWPDAYGNVHLKVEHSNLADPRNYGAPATFEIYDSVISLIAAYSGGRVYLENSKISDSIEVNGANSIIYAYGVSPVDPTKILSVMKESGGRYVELTTPGAPWK